MTELLIKANDDRTKSGIRTKRSDKDMSSGDIARAIGQALTGGNLSDSTRKELVAIQKQHQERAAKEDIARQSQRSKMKDWEPGQTADKNAMKEDLQDAKVKQWLSNNTPEQVKELGHGAQYEQDVNNPAMRSRAAANTSPGARSRMGTGEGIAVRDKAYGQDLDAQQRMKSAAARIKEARGPSDVIRVPAQAAPMPEIAPEHAQDDVVSNLVKLRGALSHPSHVAAVDEQINNRVNELKNTPMKKSTDEVLALISSGQFPLAKTR